MSGDDEVARQDAERAPADVERRAADTLVPDSVREASATPEFGASRDSTQSRVDLDPPSGLPSAEPLQSRTVSLAPLWIVTIAGLLILAGAIWYLFTLLPDQSRLSTTETAVRDLQTKVASLEAKPATPDTGAMTRRLDADDKAIAALTTQLAALRSQAGTGGPSGAANDVAPLAAKVADLEKTVDSIRSGVPDAVKQATAPLDQRLSALSAQVDALPKVDLGPLTARVDALDARLKPIAAEYEASKSPARVTTVRQNGSAAETRAAPIAVTADAVQRAIDAGRPFGDEVKVLAQLGADAKLLAPLQAVAATGAPTTKDLRGDLAAARDKIDARAAPAPTGSYLDRLMAGASSMVQVKPVGSVVGDAPQAVLARMDDDLARDDLSAALAEWQKLPEADRTIAKDLAARIRLRLAAEDAARSIGAQAIGAMATDQP